MSGSIASMAVGGTKFSQSINTTEIWVVDPVREEWVCAFCNGMIRAEDIVDIIKYISASPEEQELRFPEGWAPSPY